jgi:hypothetical protein
LQPRKDFLARALLVSCSCFHNRTILTLDAAKVRQFPDIPAKDGAFFLRNLGI